MADSGTNKLILAVLQGDDYSSTIKALNEAGFFVTLLSSTGGFLRKKSTTVMVGVEEDRKPQVLEILKRCAGKRKEMVYQTVTLPHGGEIAPFRPSPWSGPPAASRYLPWSWRISRSFKASQTRHATPFGVLRALFV